jgi:hypothetical protein
MDSCRKPPIAPSLVSPATLDQLTNAELATSFPSNNASHSDKQTLVAKTPAPKTIISTPVAL